MGARKPKPFLLENHFTVPLIFAMVRKVWLLYALRQPQIFVGKTRWLVSSWTTENRDITSTHYLVHAT